MKSEDRQIDSEARRNVIRGINKILFIRQNLAYLDTRVFFFSFSGVFSIINYKFLYCRNTSSDVPKSQSLLKYKI